MLRMIAPAFLAGLLAGCLRPGSPDGGETDSGETWYDGGTVASFTVSASYTISPGREAYECFRSTIHLQGTEYVDAFVPAEVNGTHHVVLFVTANPTEPDGTGSCSGGFTGLGQTLLYAAGSGASAFRFPDGVGFAIQDGDQFILQVHEFNAGTSIISGTTRLEVDFLPPGAAVTVAQVVLAGAVGFTIPANATSYAVQGQCSKMPPGANVFAALPHMHQIGSSITASLSGSTANQTLFDVGSWTWTEQPNFDFSPPLVTPDGGVEQVTCVYDNPYGHSVSYGPNSTDEMCYAITFFYPADFTVPDICVN